MIDVKLMRIDKYFYIYNIRTTGNMLSNVNFLLFYYNDIII